MTTPLAHPGDKRELPNTTYLLPENDSGWWTDGRSERGGIVFQPRVGRSLLAMHGYDIFSSGYRCQAGLQPQSLACFLLHNIFRGDDPAELTAMLRHNMSSSGNRCSTEVTESYLVHCNSYLSLSL